MRKQYRTPNNPQLKQPTQGTLVDFSLKNERITTGKEINSPKDDKNNDILEDELLCEDIPNFEDKKDSEEEEDEEDELPLMKVRRLSFKSKELGKLRNSLRIKEVTEGGTNIDKEKANKAAEKYFKKRQNFVKSAQVRTDVDFRKNRLFFDKLKNLDEGSKRKYTAVITEVNDYDFGDDKNYVYKKNYIRSNTGYEKNDDIDKKKEKFYVSKYTKFDNNNTPRIIYNLTETNDDSGNAKYKYLTYVETSDEKNKNLKNNNDKNKKLFVKTSEFTTSKLPEPTSYRRRYHNPISKSNINETEVEISMKPKIDQDTKKESKTITTKYYSRVRVPKNQGKINDKKEDDAKEKKVVGNNNSESGYVKRRKH